jgi:hypothetical protein
VRFVQIELMRGIWVRQQPQSVMEHSQGVETAVAATTGKGSFEKAKTSSYPRLTEAKQSLCAFLFSSD